MRNHPLLTNLVFLLSLLSGALLSAGRALCAVAAVMLLSWRCAAVALLSMDRPRL